MLSGFLPSQLSLKLFPLVCLLYSLISFIPPISFHFLNPIPCIFFPFSFHSCCFLSYSHLSLIQRKESFSTCLRIYSLFSLHSSFLHCPVLSPLLFYPCVLLSFLILSFNPICPRSHAVLQTGSCVSLAAIGYRLL